MLNTSISVFLGFRKRRQLLGFRRRRRILLQQPKTGKEINSVAQEKTQRIVSARQRHGHRESQGSQRPSQERVDLGVNQGDHFSELARQHEGL